MNVYGERSLAALNARLSSLAQLAGIDHLTVAQGPGRGNELLVVRNGAGLCFEVNISRGYDIRRCELGGVPMAWLSAVGHAAPGSYDPAGRGWNRGFEGGMLTTCGLGHAGRAETVDGKEYGLHGRYSYLPAAQVAWELQLGEEPGILLRGAVRQMMVGGDCLALYRSIRVPLFGNAIVVEDEIVNEGGTDAIHMLLYHINLGFPLISPTTRIKAIDSTPEVVSGETDPAEYRSVFPSKPCAPDVILHRNVQSKGDRVTLDVQNTVPLHGKACTLGLMITYNKTQCPYLTQWRHFGPGMNVFAFEPGNVSTKGLDFHRKEGTLCVLRPGQRRSCRLELTYQMDWSKS